MVLVHQEVNNHGSNILGFPGYHITREGKLYNKGHPVKTFFHKGYERTKLRNNKVSKNVKIHRLVAEAYIPNPNNLPVVMHLDDNPLNNSLENLKWGTQKDNVYDAINKGRLKLKGINNPMYGVSRRGLFAPHTSLTVRSIRRLERLKLKGNTNKYIAKRLKVSNATVGNYLNGKHYKS